MYSDQLSHLIPKRNNVPNSIMYVYTYIKLLVFAKKVKNNNKILGR